MCRRDHRLTASHHPMSQQHHPELRYTRQDPHRSPGSSHLQLGCTCSSRIAMIRRLQCSALRRRRAVCRALPQRTPSRSCLRMQCQLQSHHMLQQGRTHPPWSKFPQCGTARRTGLAARCFRLHRNPLCTCCRQRSTKYLARRHMSLPRLHRGYPDLRLHRLPAMGSPPGEVLVRSSETTREGLRFTLCSRDPRDYFRTILPRG